MTPIKITIISPKMAAPFGSAHSAQDTPHGGLVNGRQTGIDVPTQVSPIELYPSKQLPHITLIEASGRPALHCPSAKHSRAGQATVWSCAPAGVGTSQYPGLTTSKPPVHVKPESY